MSLKTVRVCDQCKGESPEMNDFYVVKLYRSSPALPNTLNEVAKEVCSFHCANTAMSDWIASQR